MNLPFSSCNLLALLRQLVLFLALLPSTSTLFADETLVAVASNFAVPAREIATAFAAETGYQAIISTGSSGKLFAQIAQGAPFDLFLSADRAHAEKLLNSGKAVAGSNFTYAIGQLALYSKDPNLVDTQGKILNNSQHLKNIAIANPKLAPYGIAAIEAMKKLGVYESLKPKLVMGENIAQTFHFVNSGNAALGFVAFSQLRALSQLKAHSRLKAHSQLKSHSQPGESTEGSWWIVPAEIYTPIRQDAVLLWHGEDSEAAMAFLEFLKSETAWEIIRRYGYITENDAPADR